MALGATNVAQPCVGRALSGDVQSAILPPAYHISSASIFIFLRAWQTLWEEREVVAEAWGPPVIGVLPQQPRVCAWSGRAGMTAHLSGPSHPLLPNRAFMQQRGLPVCTNKRLPDSKFHDVHKPTIDPNT